MFNEPINWILLVTVSTEFLLRVLPTKSDVSLLKVARFVLNLIHDVLPQNMKNNGDSKILK
jgi:hypothetical protein